MGHVIDFRVKDHICPVNPRPDFGNMAALLGHDEFVSFSPAANNNSLFRKMWETAADAMPPLMGDIPAEMNFPFSTPSNVSIISAFRKLAAAIKTRAVSDARALATHIKTRTPELFTKKRIFTTVLQIADAGNAAYGVYAGRVDQNTQRWIGSVWGVGVPVIVAYADDEKEPPRGKNFLYKAAYAITHPLWHPLYFAKYVGVPLAVYAIESQYYMGTVLGRSDLCWLALLNGVGLVAGLRSLHNESRRKERAIKEGLPLDAPLPVRNWADKYLDQYLFGHRGTAFGIGVISNYLLFKDALHVWATEPHRGKTLFIGAVSSAALLAANQLYIEKQFNSAVWRFAAAVTTRGMERLDRCVSPVWRSAVTVTNRGTDRLDKSVSAVRVMKNTVRDTVVRTSRQQLAGALLSAKLALQPAPAAVLRAPSHFAAPLR